MAQDLFHYEKMVERALRGVVREALQRVAKEGLRSAHHFYIGFATGAPGVVIPDHLRARYPQEMTIILQHQFWDLEIGEDGFAVTLSFQQKPERLEIPFAAVRSFADPSVNFALEFAVAGGEAPKPAAVPAALVAPPKPAEETAPKPTGEVVALDSFRKR